MPVALWFGKDEVMRTQISVLGLIAAGPDGAAVLSVDGGPPLAWRVGTEVAPGIVLRDIAADAVTVEQGGRLNKLATPAALEAPAGIANVK
jgi:general secretion pathway protein C